MDPYLFYTYIILLELYCFKEWWFFDIRLIFFLWLNLNFLFNRFFLNSLGGFVLRSFTHHSRYIIFRCFIMTWLRNLLLLTLGLLKLLLLTLLWLWLGKIYLNWLVLILLVELLILLSLIEILRDVLLIVDQFVICCIYILNFLY